MDSTTHGHPYTVGTGNSFQNFITSDFLGNREGAVQYISIRQKATGSLTNNFTAVMKMEVYETISFIGILILDPKKKEVRACALYLLRY
jgi:hypothetical protein